MGAGEPLYYLLSRGRVRFRKRESTREAKTADTHIPNSRAENKKRYANLPHHTREATPASILDNAAATRRSLSSSSSSSPPVTTQHNATTFRRSSSSKTSPADMAPCRRLNDASRLCILSFLNLLCHWDSSAVSLMPSPLSFRLEAK